MSGSIELEVGPMGGGKSLRLIESYHALQANGLKVAAFQSDKNDRDDGIISRAGCRIPAAKIASLHEIDMQQLDAVIVDEFHFFDNAEDEAAWCNSARELGKIVTVGLLDYDYRGELWAGYKTLLDVFPNHINYLTSRCDEPPACETPARYSALLLDGIQQTEGTQLIVEDRKWTDMVYSPRCGDHFLPPRVDLSVD